MEHLTNQDIKKFISALKRTSKYDFSDYSVKSFTRRIEKILNDYNISLENLIYKITEDKQFREKIVKEITVNTTEIFRDPEMWQFLFQLIPQNFQNEKDLKIWHPGCSTGQEVYSMLILLYITGYYKEASVFGTDINTDVLKEAQKAVYRYRDIKEYINNFTIALKNYPEIKIDEFFDINEKKDTFAVKKFLKKKPIFLKHDLVNDGNIFGTKFHIIMCRNVLIYFNHELQTKILNFFYENLYKNGMLIIGKHEGILGELSYKFKRHGSIYIKKTKNSVYFDF